MRIITTSLAIFIVTGTLHTGFAADAEKTDPNKVLRDQMAIFKKKASTLEEQSTAADQILALGVKGAKPLYREVHRSLKSTWMSYRKRLCGLASGVFKKKKLKSQMTVIKKHWQTLGTLRKAPTKEEAKSKGLPALEALREILIVDIAALKEDKPDLEKTREKIIAFHGLRERCIKMLTEAAANSKKKKKSSRKPSKAPPVEPSTVQEQLKCFELMASVWPLSKKSPALAKNEILAAQINITEAMGILDLNIIRLLSGLKPLQIDSRLCDAARDHCRDMAEKNFFAHESTVPGKRKFTDRAKNFGASASAENIAKGQRTFTLVNIGWFLSPGHHKNMLNPRHKLMGLGEYQKLWCQMFR